MNEATFDIVTCAGGQFPGPGVQHRGGYDDVAAFFQRASASSQFKDRPTHSYSQVAAVYACVKAKADALAGLPLMISAADDQVIESGPLAELAERPNQKMTARAFFRATSAHLDLFGRAHWVMLLSPGGQPVEVFPISPLLMTPRLNRQTGELLAWEYRPAGRFRGAVEVLAVDQVHTFVDPDFEAPDRPLEGLSPRRAVSNAIAQFHAADLANEASISNGVEPGLIFRSANFNLTDEQRNNLKQFLREHHEGSLNRRRSILLEGLEVVPLPVNFKDAEFTELKKMTREDICAAFGVPPAVVGWFEGSNYAHADAAEKGFWIRTMLPRAAWLAEEWDSGILARFDGDRSLAVAEARTAPLDFRQQSCRGLIGARRAARRARRRFFAWFDSSIVPAVQQALLGQAETAAKWWAMGVPLNSLIRSTDAPIEEQPHGDQGMKPIGLEPYGVETLDTIADPDGADETGLMPPPEGPSKGVYRPRGAAEPQTILKASDRLRASLWALWRKSWQPLERVAEREVKAHFFELRSIVLANLAKAAGELPPELERSFRNFRGDQRRDVIGQILFDLAPAKGKLVVRMGKLIKEGYRLGGAQAMQEAADATGQETPSLFNIEDPAVARKMRARTVKLGDVDETLRRRVARELAEGIDQQETVEQITERIKEQFNFARTRAATIARTEIGAAVEEARDAGRSQAKVPLKSWLHSRKELGRPTHAATEEETMAAPIQQGEDFTIAGTSEQCAHPRDARLPVEHTANCGCTTLARYPKDSLKAVLARYATRGFLTYEQLVKRDQAGHARITQGSTDDSPQ